MQSGRIGTLFGGAKKRHILLWEFDCGPESNVLVVDGKALFEPILSRVKSQGPIIEVLFSRPPTRP